MMTAAIGGAGGRSPPFRTAYAFALSGQQLGRTFTRLDAAAPVTAVPEA